MKFNMRSRAAVIVIIALFAAACGSLAYNSATQFISKSADGLAIEGYDAVAYRTIESAAQGKPEYEFVWNGAKWLFVSEENRARFAANPESYAPEYGGFCAWSLSENSMMRADPKVWKVVDNKLYLIQNEMVKEVWEKSQPELIEKSNRNWQKMKDK
jgi:YHS domain-containing protein